MIFTGWHFYSKHKLHADCSSFLGGQSCLALLRNDSAASLTGQQLATVPHASHDARCCWWSSLFKRNTDLQVSWNVELSRTSRWKSCGKFSTNSLQDSRSILTDDGKHQPDRLWLTPHGEFPEAREALQNLAWRNVRKTAERREIVDVLRCSSRPATDLNTESQILHSGAQRDRQLTTTWTALLRNLLPSTGPSHLFGVSAFSVFVCGGIQASLNYHPTLLQTSRRRERDDKLPITKTKWNIHIIAVKLIDKINVLFDYIQNSIHLVTQRVAIHSKQSKYPSVWTTATLLSPAAGLAWRQDCLHLQLEFGRDGLARRQRHQYKTNWTASPSRHWGDEQHGNVLCCIWSQRIPIGCCFPPLGETLRRSYGLRASARVSSGVCGSTVKH